MAAVLRCKARDITAISTSAASRYHGYRLMLIYFSSTPGRAMLKLRPKFNGVSWIMLG